MTNTMNPEDYMRAPLIGPGSQLEGNEDALAYLSMPHDMRTYKPHIPQIDEKNLPKVVDYLKSLLGVLSEWNCDDEKEVSFKSFDLETIKLLDETLGEGEVAVKYVDALTHIEIQETAMAGLWRMNKYDNKKVVPTLYVSSFPKIVLEKVFPQSFNYDAIFALALREQGTEGMINGSAILHEIAQKAKNGYRVFKNEHSINLTLLPHSQQDLQMLENALGTGPLEILSRGYGSCRITAAQMPYVWFVRYYNSSDQEILCTIEVAVVPAVACAAAEDIEDSTERLRDLINIL